MYSRPLAPISVRHGQFVVHVQDISLLPAVLSALMVCGSGPVSSMGETIDIGSTKAFDPEDKRISFVASDFDTETKTATESSDKEKIYEVPVGQFTTPPRVSRPPTAKVLCQPSSSGKEARGSHDTMFQSIKKCDGDIRKGLFANVVLPGGTTMRSDIGERSAKESTALAPSTMKTKVVVPPVSYHRDVGIRKASKPTVRTLIDFDACNLPPCQAPSAVAE